MKPLKPVARYVINRKEVREAINNYLSGKIFWKDKSLTQIKKTIRTLLRLEQKGICPYCQRLIFPERRNVGEHIEHFFDKSKPKYKKFAFSASNLVLSCQACNVVKSTKDMLPVGRQPLIYLREAESPFLWPHPYYDVMSECIKKLPGPVYEPIIGSGRETESNRLIKDLQLNEIMNLEMRHSILTYRRDRLIDILGRLAEKEDLRSMARMRRLNLELKKVRNEIN
ncbi:MULTISPECIES: hypothetical protein [Pantoea]|uniref:hypothetical protein n=1 Tax=Pantoea TaxID=53335 RepID=UPI0011BDE916|nr:MULTISPECIES: hypothetical protein [Pantoea]WNK38663.1 hypothetical protein RM160_12675 [Pantoea agglomerans]